MSLIVPLPLSLPLPLAPPLPASVFLSLSLPPSPPHTQQLPSPSLSVESSLGQKPDLHFAVVSFAGRMAAAAVSSVPYMERHRREMGFVNVLESGTLAFLAA